MTHHRALPPRLLPPPIDRGEMASTDDSHYQRIERAKVHCLDLLEALRVTLREEGFPMREPQMTRLEKDFTTLLTAYKMFLKERRIWA